MQDLIFLESVDSTNAEARRRWGSNPPVHGTALVARRQVAGRGRQGSAWHAEPGRHLAMTVLLRPTTTDPAMLPLINQKVSLGVAKAVNRLAPDLAVRIKWPNDLFVGTRKLAGILIENILSGKTVTCMMAGIGLNVNEEVFPDHLPFAVSLRQLTGQVFDLDRVAATVRDQVIREVDHTGEGWRPLYRSLLFGLGENHRFAGPDGPVEGIIRGVDDQGRLELETAEGFRQAWHSHEIKWQR